MLINTFRSGNFNVSIYNSIRSEIADKWNSFVTEALHSNYLGLLEDSKPLDLDFRYVIIEEFSGSDRIICAVIYFQQLKFTKRNIHFTNSIFLTLFSSLLLAIRPFRVCICGNLFAVDYPAIRYRKDLIGPHDLLQILSAIEKKFTSDLIVLKDLGEEFNAGTMSEFGWTPYTSDLTMIMKIDPNWKSLVDYIHSLSKKYRKRAERIVISGEKIERREIDKNEILIQFPAIKKLYEQVVLKQTIRMGLIGPEYFYEYKNRFPDSFSFIGYYFKNDLIAFSTYIDHGKMLETHYIGIDYKFNKDQMIYFNILMDSIQMAIKMKKELLELGRTAREAKANMGGEPEYYNDHVKVRGILANALSKRIISYFQKEIGENWTERHPFKK